MKKLLMILILICVFSSNAFGGEWRSPYRSYSPYYSPYYGDSNGYLKSMIYGNTNKINQNSYKVSNNEIKISRNSVKTGQNEANIIQNSTKGLNNQNAIIQNAADIETLQSGSDGGSSSEVNPFKYATYANGQLIGMSKIKVSLRFMETEVVLRYSDDFTEIILNKEGKLKDFEENLYYTTKNCQGKKYRMLGGDQYFYFDKFKGLVLNHYGDLYYFPSNAPILSNLNFKSTFSTGTSRGITETKCRPRNGVLMYGIEVFPNDPSVTGIYEYPFPTPITFDGMPTQ